MLKIWWSSGDFYRVSDQRNTDEQCAKYFSLPETNALEIMFYNAKNLDHEISKEMIEKSFSHCSIHAPTRHSYQHDEESHRIFKAIEQVCLLLPIKNIVIHPDNVVDWTFFEQYKHLPLSIENMDERKKSFKSVEDVKNILDRFPYFWLTLDLQHCFVNDVTMQLAKDFHREVWHKIVEYHIAGYHPQLLHYPLFKTHQDIIITALEKPEIPIIIESTFDEEGELAKEIAYIKNILWA
jgi:hypothetical protein